MGILARVTKPKLMLVETRRARSIPFYAGLAALTIAAGLASRAYADALPPFVARYAGDALWAALVFWLLALAWRRSSTAAITVASLVIAFATEISQLYHASWIDSLRATWFGGLVLGSGFLWSDLVCYAAGIAIAAGCDTLPLARNKPQ